MKTEKELTTEEALEYLARKGHVRTLSWFKKMVARKKILIFRKRGTMNFYHITELNRVAREKPSLRLAAALAAFLLLGSNAWAGVPIEPTAWQFIVVHITETRLDYDLEMCDTGHSQRPGYKKTNGHFCGYSYLITRTGEIQEARGMRWSGAHAAGHNSKALGIGLVGNSRTPITEEQVAAFEILRNSIEAMARKDLRLVPHRHLNVNKTCPAHAWDRLLDEGIRP